MESNFIKERIVVREQIIKKNLDGKPAKPGPSSLENPPERVVAFEELINERLKQDLVDISKQVDTICQTMADYIKVKSALKIFRSNPTDIRLLTNIGCNFYAQCHVDDATKVYICVGQDYFLQMELDEAIKMVEFKEAQWMKQLDILQEKASKIKAYIKIALETVGRLYELDKEKLKA